MTGETGAGKSIIINSLNALLAPVFQRLIRSGSDKHLFRAFSHGSDLSELLDTYGIETQDDGNILISRVITESGKNICRVNGTMVTVSMLREIGQKLVDIHGQHDNQSLLRAETHIELLDLFTGEKLAEEKREYRMLLERLHELKSKLKALSGEGKERNAPLIC